jgi:hypothetical protein
MTGPIVSGAYKGEMTANCVRSQLVPDSSFEANPSKDPSESRG